MKKDYAVLFDATKCIGCGSCTVACKLWNDLPFEGNAHGYGAGLDDTTWTVVQYYDLKKDGEDVLRFAKQQCRHCLEPACASVCFAKAITVDQGGAVVYNAKKCVGCRYCMIACPYDVPKYEWGKVFPSVMKCQFCADKLANNENPACTSACPSGALLFGDRESLLSEARTRLAGDSGYVQQIYGEKEAGGSRWLTIADVPLDELGLPQKVSAASIPGLVHDYLKWKPGVFLGAAAVFGALGFYTHRRLKVEAAEKAEKEENNDV